MSTYLGWHIRGYYDGKILLLEEGFNKEDCVFLDMELLRPGVRSVGQHMVMYDSRDKSGFWDTLDDCISANNLRHYNFKHNFIAKYPFGTVHLLLSILGQRITIPIEKSAVCPLLYTDGTFKNQFNYPENCLSWLEFLGADDAHNPLQKVFIDKHYSTFELMMELRILFDDIRRVGGGRRGGDKITISNSRGKPIQLTDEGHLPLETTLQAEAFLGVLSEKTLWPYDKEHWSWGPYRVTTYRKESIVPGQARYYDLLAKNPLSLAITSRNSIEYTIES